MSRLPLGPPTRFLDVGTTEMPELRLVDTYAWPTQLCVLYTAIKYNTLSYCWGVSQPVTLSTTNIDRFLKGIAIEELPRTIADAIVVTRAMGVPYLWIDALCIIQDSTNDWETESKMMDDVYGGSYCNLAASHNVNSTDGLFPVGWGNIERPISVRIKEPPDTDSSYCDTILTGENFWCDRVEDAPLNRRGWVVQELRIYPVLVRTLRPCLYHPLH